jgi:hypothetical protein
MREQGVAVPGDLQLEARALGDATRYRLFRYIVEAARPVGVGELTEHVRLNYNGVRPAPGGAESRRAGDRGDRAA